MLQKYLGNNKAFCVKKEKNVTAEVVGEVKHKRVFLNVIVKKNKVDYFILELQQTKPCDVYLRVQSEDYYYQSLSVFHFLGVNYKRYLHTRARLSTSVMDPVETGEKVLILHTQSKILEQCIYYHDVMFG